jgi:hypothetical protein
MEVSPHDHPLAVRNSGVFSAIGLLMRSLLYALARFAVLFTFSVGCILDAWLSGRKWLGQPTRGEK